MSGKHRALVAASEFCVIMTVGMTTGISHAASAGCAQSSTPAPAGVVASQVDLARAVIGATPEQVHANFAGVIERNFLLGNANRIIHNLSPKELADLATLYSRAKEGNASPLLNILAKRVDASGLALVARAFGQQQTALAVETEAPAAVADQFFSSASGAAFQPSKMVAQFAGAGMAQPLGGSLGYTPYEIYLDYRTAPIGSLGVTDALYETTLDISSGVGFAWAGGQAIGTAVNDVIETYDPSLEDAIGGTVSNMADQISTAGSEFSEGELEASMDSLFGGSVPESSGNDYNVSYPMAFWYINYYG